MSGFNFRLTSGYVTDAVGDTYVIDTDVYPITRNSEAFGYAGSAPQHIDRDAAADPKLAGIANIGNAGADYLFVVDSGSGTFDVEVAAGDTGNVTNPYIEICDVNTSNVVQSVLAVIDGTAGVPNNDYIDAAEVTHDGPAAWVSSQSAIQVAVTSGRIGVRLGNTASAGATTLAHLSVTQVVAATNPILTDTLLDAENSNAAVANETNLTVHVYDTDGGTELYSTTTATTDGSGVFTIDDDSVGSVDDTPFVVIKRSNGQTACGTMTVVDGNA